MKRTLVVVALLLLTGCVNNPPPLPMDTPEAVARQITTHTDTAIGVTVTRGNDYVVVR
jgi:starvation-inducible outer membrane lipoprotein